jgi:hypothetical protein
MIRVAILGAGGLGRGMARMLAARPGFQWVGVADSSGFAYQPDGIDLAHVEGMTPVCQWPDIGQMSVDSIMRLMTDHGHAIDAVFMALPNLPVDFYAQTLERIATETPFRGVMVDALKRTEAVELLQPLDKVLRQQGILYITGAGATPGFLTTVAAVAAQSFVDVLAVDIHFGVGVANWEAYRATIREDFLHMPGFNAERVAAMTDEDIERELDQRNGLLELVDMEHADDVILELAGICPRDRITVGGVVDCRNAKKPVSTTVSVKGRTVAGDVTTHQFVVGDATTMVDNVCGPACGFMARAVELYNVGVAGLKTSAEVMPRYNATGLELQRWTSAAGAEVATLTQ